MKTRFNVAAALAASLFVACAGAPKVIPEDLGARELVQRAQECSDAYNYKGAVAYYQALDQRFSTDPLYSSTAEYEIAFIAYKEGHYSAARKGFEALLAKYAGPDGASYPPRFEILAKKVLDTIAQKTKSGASAQAAQPAAAQTAPPAAPAAGQ
jgi:outer membrane protein assembly factor BamD (BamD/ComL family)